MLERTRISLLQCFNFTYDTINLIFEIFSGFKEKRIPIPNRKSTRKPTVANGCNAATKPFANY